MAIFLDGPAIAALDLDAGFHALSEVHGHIPSHEELLARVDTLIPALRERAEETERLRRIPESTMAELQEAGVFKILAPKGVGGYGLGVETYVEVVRRLAQGCPSTAWNAGHLIEHVWMLARWPKEAQDEVFAEGPDPLAAATGAPPGNAEQVPGGFRITGRWSFASGVLHSQWALLAVEHNRPGRSKVRLQCLVPIDDVEVVDTWHTAGLRGTGSNDIHAEGLFIPAHRTVEWSLLAAADNPGSRIHPDPMIHTTMATLLNIVAPSAALGAAEYALELFRGQMLKRKVKNTVENRQGDSPLAQARFAQAYGLVATARLHWAEAARLAAASHRRHPGQVSGAGMTEEEKARYRLSFALSGEASAQAVTMIMAGSGGSAHRLTHPLQRIQRDVSVLLNHPTLATDPILEQAGRGLLGLGLTLASFQQGAAT
ncbi:acyl-CoA dehydrogenase family protein [Pseudarthrobacter siccitolerans]